MVLMECEASGKMIMGANHRCPRCGSNHVQLTQESNKHGCLWTLIFGIYYIVWYLVRLHIAFALFCFYDWWMAIIRKIQGRGHVWQSKRWASNRRRIYFCHNCGHNFIV